MKRLRILQVGDIHFPWSENVAPRADFGTSPDNISVVSSSLKTPGVALNKLAASIRNICDPKPDLVVFVGDFTVKGDPDNLDKAVKYCLNGLLKPIFSQEEISERVLFVPGNHDVTRPVEGSTDPYEKFETYRLAMENNGITNHSTRNFGRVTVPVSGSTVSALGINTCLGCGEFRALPSKLRTAISEAINGYHIPATAPKLIEDVSEIAEQLDMPLLDRKDIDGLDVELTGIHGKSPIIVGHHNLLPQKETRVLPYGELINSGVLREVLATKDYPVLYLHGHIHSDPIELIRDPLHHDGGILSISAPMITDGVNIVDLYLDADLEPIGVDIIPWRFSPTLQLVRNRSLRISMAHGENRLASLPEEARRIFRYLVHAGDAAHRHLSQLSDELGLDIDLIARNCEALSWAGLVHVANAHKSPPKWDIRLAI
ncbi:metallophosphoesterase [Shinella sp. WSJ-2]|uniref:metallophosphoesterase family protein n=1 Tax=Shinella sp. WSJ-2 TaxID=2303749 RepID=UPI000E3D0DFD|nr:metallophosphoesterase [Shinella sp. WSJ-2]RFZ83853.1 metallophosphoesterase [Shinella sp. WSJ-2]